MNNPIPERNDPPIGVLQSLARGFDRVTAQPLLLLPPVLLDLFLWLGPRLRLPAEGLELGAMPGALAWVFGGGERAQGLQYTLQDFAASANWLAILSGPPLGLPTVMAGRMPAQAPIGPAPAILLDPPSALLLLGLALLALGQLLGGSYHIWIARQVAGERVDGGGRRGAVRLMGMGLLAYFALSFLMVSLLALLRLLLVLPALIGMTVFFIGFTFIFWLLVYLAFTPHGIARYGLSIPRAALESVLLVRWNLPDVVGFLGLSVLITWVTNQVWRMPYEQSWYNALAILGHALVSATLLAASYVFYQGRREWLQARQAEWQAAQSKQHRSL